MVSLDSLKNSTMQIVLKVDRSFSDTRHQQVLEKINLVQRFKSITGNRVGRTLVMHDGELGDFTVGPKDNA
jgi:hypothetical protein